MEILALLLLHLVQEQRRQLVVLHRVRLCRRRRVLLTRAPCSSAISRSYQTKRTMVGELRAEQAGCTAIARVAVIIQPLEALYQVRLGLGLTPPVSSVRAQQPGLFDD